MRLVRLPFPLVLFSELVNLRRATLTLPRVRECTSPIDVEE